MQEMFKKNLGVDIKLENKEWKSYIDTYKQSDFQLAYMGWGGSLLDPITKLDLYAGDIRITMQSGIIKNLTL